MEIGRFVKTIDLSVSNYPDIAFSKKGTINTCVNPYSYHIARRHGYVYDKMDGLYVDGMLMTTLINLFWKKKIRRLSFDMTGMAVDLFERLNSNGETIYFIGSKQDDLEASVNHIQSSYPGMHVAGYRNGYFSNEAERQDVINKIVALNPDFVIIGMGSPLQEKFAIDLKDSGYKGIAFTCGGFLHQTSKGIHYYPHWVNRFNLRAIYRIFHERGLLGRLYNVVLEFPILFTWDTIMDKFKRSK